MELGSSLKVGRIFDVQEDPDLTVSDFEGDALVIDVNGVKISECLNIVGMQIDYLFPALGKIAQHSCDSASTVELNHLPGLFGVSKTVSRAILCLPEDDADKKEFSEEEKKQILAAELQQAYAAGLASLIVSAPDSTDETTLLASVLTDGPTELISEGGTTEVWVIFRLMSDTDTNSFSNWQKLKTEIGDRNNIRPCLTIDNDMLAREDVAQIAASWLCEPVAAVLLSDKFFYREPPSSNPKFVYEESWVAQFLSQVLLRPAQHCYMLLNSGSRYRDDDMSSTGSADLSSDTAGATESDPVDGFMASKLAELRLSPETQKSLTDLIQYDFSAALTKCMVDCGLSETRSLEFCSDLQAFLSVSSDGSSTCKADALAGWNKRALISDQICESDGETNIFGDALKSALLIALASDCGLRHWVQLGYLALSTVGTSQSANQAMGFQAARMGEVFCDLSRSLIDPYLSAWSELKPGWTIHIAIFNAGLGQFADKLISVIEELAPLSAKLRLYLIEENSESMKFLFSKKMSIWNNCKNISDIVIKSDLDPWVPLAVNCVASDLAFTTPLAMLGVGLPGRMLYNPLDNCVFLPAEVKTFMMPVYSHELSAMVKEQKVEERKTFCSKIHELDLCPGAVLPIAKPTALLKIVNFEIVSPFTEHPGMDIAHKWAYNEVSQHTAAVSGFMIYMNVKLASYSHQEAYSNAPFSMLKRGIRFLHVPCLYIPLMETKGIEKGEKIRFILIINKAVKKCFFSWSAAVNSSKSHLMNSAGNVQTFAFPHWSAEEN